MDIERTWDDWFPILKALNQSRNNFEENPRAEEIRRAYPSEMETIQKTLAAAESALENVPLRRQGKAPDSVIQYVRAFATFYAFVTPLLGKKDTAKLLPTEEIETKHLEMLASKEPALEVLFKFATSVMDSEATDKMSRSAELRLRAMKNVEAEIANITKIASAQSEAQTLSAVVQEKRPDTSAPKAAGKIVLG